MPCKRRNHYAVMNPNELYQNSHYLLILNLAAPEYTPDTFTAYANQRKQTVPGL